MARLSHLAPSLPALGPAVKPAPKVADAFYLSAEWKALKAKLRAEGKAFCKVCGETRGVHADHIVEIKDGGARLDPSNIQFLCPKHHNPKTAKARAARAGGWSKV